MDRKFTAKAVSKAIAYTNAGKMAQALTWFQALQDEIDPKGLFKRIEPGQLKDEDVEYLEAMGHPVTKLVKASDSEEIEHEEVA